MLSEADHEDEAKSYVHRNRSLYGHEPRPPLEPHLYTRGGQFGGLVIVGWNSDGKNPYVDVLNYGRIRVYGPGENDSVYVRRKV